MTQSVQIHVWGFVLNLVLAASLSFVLGYVYSQYGQSLSNRKQFSKNFVLVAMTTMLIISIVKASLALSLGLVGALSIVRFRSAIKEPEELAYLFLTISIGLGFGADQRLITMIAFVIIVGAIWMRHTFTQAVDSWQNLHLTVSSSSASARIDLPKIVSILTSSCRKVDLKRLDETPDLIDVSFFVEFDGYAPLEQLKNNLRAHDPSVQVTFLDNSGMLG